MNNTSYQNTNHSYYIDFCKGLLVYSIIFIHVAFWSGETYVPEWVRNLSLLFDVPMFFFLSGWRTALSNELNWGRILKSCLDLMLKYWFFTTFYYILWLVFLKNYYPEIGLSKILPLFITNCMFCGESIPGVPLVIGSMWFMPVYLTVRVVVTGILNLASGTKHNQHNAIVVLLLSIIGFVFVTNGGTFFFLSQNTLCYTFFFLLGYVTKGKPLTNIGFLLITFFIVICMILSTILFEVSYINIQNLKFPASFAWILYSLFSISLCLWWSHIEINSSNFFVWCGKNCLWFYFAQGLSGSFILWLAPQINMSWPFKLVICFLINASFCTVGGYILSILWKQISMRGEKLLVYLQKIWRK